MNFDNSKLGNCAIHSIKISANFGPKLNGSVRSNRKSFEKTGPPFEVDHKAGQRLQNSQDNVCVRSYGSTLSSRYTPFTLSSAEDSPLSFAAIIGGYSFLGKCSFYNEN